MESTQSKLFKMLLKLVRRKQFWYKTGNELVEGILKRRKLDYRPPASIVKTMQMTLHEEKGFQYYVINETAAIQPIHIIYLHGGGYVHNITKYHWHFLSRLAQALQCTITIPLYPLAPENTYKETFECVSPLYEKVIRKSGAKHTVVMGDSAGGGLAFALIQLMKKQGVPLPKQTVLISPWLDLTLKNKEIDDIDSLDPFLAKPGAMEAGKMYAGDKNPNHYLLSPINGDVTGLGKVAMFMGTHDILVADARKLVNRMEAAGSPITYYEYANMIHVFPLFTFPEAKRAFEHMIEWMEQK